MAATLFVTGISIVLLLLEAGVPQLRGVVTREKDSERPGARTVRLAVDGLLMHAPHSSHCIII